MYKLTFLLYKLYKSLLKQDARLVLWSACSRYNSETGGQNEKKKWQIYTLISNGNVSS